MAREMLKSSQLKETLDLPDMKTCYKDIVYKRAERGVRVEGNSGRQQVLTWYSWVMGTIQDHKKCGSIQYYHLMKIKQIPGKKENLIKNKS